LGGPGYSAAGARQVVGVLDPWACHRPILAYACQR
jgi:hypothetical protein